MQNLIPAIITYLIYFLFATIVIIIAKLLTDILLDVNRNKKRKPFLKKSFTDIVKHNLKLLYNTFYKV